MICSLFLTNLSYSALTLGEPNKRFTSQFFLEKLNLAKTYWKNKDFNNVIKILTINIENENTPKNIYIESLIHRAKAYYILNLNQKALFDLKKCIIIEECNKPEISFLLAKSYEKTGNLIRASEIYISILKCKKSNLKLKLNALKFFNKM